MMKFKDYRGCSVLNWRTTTFRTLIYVGSKHWYWQVILPRTEISNVCTSPSCKIPPKLRQVWHYAIKEILRGGGKRDYHRTENVCEIAYWTTLREVKNFRIQSESTECVAVTKGKGKIPSPSGRQASGFSGRQVGLVQKENLWSFLHTRASGNRERTAETSGERKEYLCIKPAVNNEQRRKGEGANILFCTDGKRTDWREKVRQV